MSDTQARAWKIVDHNSEIIREVIASAEAVAADLSGNADDRQRGGYIMVEATRVNRLIDAVNALCGISLPRD